MEVRLPVSCILPGVPPRRLCGQRGLETVFPGRLEEPRCMLDRSLGYFQSFSIISNSHLWVYMSNCLLRLFAKDEFLDMKFLEQRVFVPQMFVSITLLPF